eukprot:scaffold205_cov148-Amphora_coffeaeformis.AAC.1
MRCSNRPAHQPSKCSEYCCWCSATTTLFAPASHSFASKADEAKKKTSLHVENIPVSTRRAIANALVFTDDEKTHTVVAITSSAFVHINPHTPFARGGKGQTTCLPFTPQTHQLLLSRFFLTTTDCKRTEGTKMTGEDHTDVPDVGVPGDPSLDALGHPGEVKDGDPNPHHEDDVHHHHNHHHDVNQDVVLDEKDAATSALIAEAAAAAMEAAVADVDVTAAALAAQDAAAEEHHRDQTVALAASAAAAEEAANVAAAANAKKNEQRRKRYREKAVEEEAKQAEGKKQRSSTGSVSSQSHEEALAARRLKDRQRYANMTPDQRQQYNQKRREQYHRQTELSRQKRRERERARYHSLTNDAAKDRNTRRAKLERERYQKLSAEELEAKNRRRRERAAMARQKKDSDKACLRIDDGSTLGGSSVASSHASSKRLSDEVEAAVHKAVKAETHAVDHSDMPVPPADSVEFEKTMEI